MALSLKAAEYYVSPGGDGANPGTKNQPFRTLRQARDAVRTTLAKELCPITVYLREGHYFLSEILTFTPNDSGTDESPVIYTAYKDEIPIISGAV